MAINYPSSLDGTAQFGQPTGASLLATGPDHAALHDNLSSLGTVVESVLGTTAGTSVIKSFAAGDMALQLRGNRFVIGSAGGTVLDIPEISPSSNYIQVQNANGTNSPTVSAVGSATNVNLGLSAKGVTGSVVFVSPAFGTLNSSVLGTPSVDVINARNSGTALGFGNSIYPAEGTITDSAGGTLTVNAQSAQIYYSVLGTSAGNRTIGTPTSPTSYQQLTYAFKTSGSANGTLVWASVFRISQDLGTPTLGTGVGWNYYGWRYNGIDSKWDFVGNSKNLI